MEQIDIQQYRRPIDRPVIFDEKYGSVDEQRAQTTLLFGGLTPRHERLLEGAVRGLGYSCQALPTPDIVSFELGKEFGNNAYCNPAYFTGGNLLKYLREQEDRGVSKQEILDKYAFLTAGYRGPCRFGLYEEEVRTVLRNAGFEDLRIELINIAAGLEQAQSEAVIRMDADFILALVNAIIMADVLGQLEYQIRPYEIEAGATDRIFNEVLDDIHSALQVKQSYEMPHRLREALDFVKFGKAGNLISKLIHILSTPYYTEVLQSARAKIDTIRMDRFRVRPIVKIIGEFSAAVAEGDMNFHMFRFLEEEGAEVLLEAAISTQLLRWVHLARYKLKDRKGLYAWGTKPHFWQLNRRLKHRLDYLKKAGLLSLADRLYHKQCARYQQALGCAVEELADFQELADVALPHYNWRCGAGETHLEVAHSILAHRHNQCHMALSLKPFG
jgi:predicted nucleotide-binding protein (sugar kinase/HSP70/actin superfamily)